MAPEYLNHLCKEPLKKCSCVSFIDLMVVEVDMIELRWCLKIVIYMFCQAKERKKKWKSLSCVWLCVTPCSPWNSPGQNTGVGSLSLLQGIFPTQGLNLGLPRCRRILHPLSHKRSPRTLEWVAYPFSSRSSRPRNQTGVSCIVGGFFTNWATREGIIKVSSYKVDILKIFWEVFMLENTGN